jgi:hypothetical protein
MRLIRDEQRVLLEAGPFFRFCEGGQLRALARFVGSKGYVTADVEGELELRGSSPDPRLRTHPGLANLKRLNFPSNPAIELNPEQLGELETIRQRWAEPNEHPKKHRGEISTVIAARDRSERLVVIDDVDGLKLAKANRLHTIKTTHVVAEMVAAEALSEEAAWPIFHAVRNGSRRDFENLCALYREAYAR